MISGTLQVPIKSVQAPGFVSIPLEPNEGKGWKLPASQRLVVPNASPYKTQTRMLESMAVPMLIEQQYSYHGTKEEAPPIPTTSVTYLDVYLNSQLVFTSPIPGTPLVNGDAELNSATPQFYAGSVYENFQNPLVSGDPVTLELGAHGIVVGASELTAVQIFVYFNQELSLPETGIGQQITAGNGSISYTDVDRYPEVVPVSIA